MIVLFLKTSTSSKQTFTLPNNGKLDCNEWVEISIDFDSQEFIARKFNEKTYSLQEWTVVENLTFPSSLFNRFLLNNPFDLDNLK